GGLVADPARRGGRAHRAGEREVLEKAHLAPARELGLRRASAVAGQRGDQRGEVGGVGGHDPYLREQRKNESVHIYTGGRVGKWFLGPTPNPSRRREGDFIYRRATSRTSAWC